MLKNFEVGGVFSFSKIHYSPPNFPNQVQQPYGPLYHKRHYFRKKPWLNCSSVILTKIKEMIEVVDEINSRVTIRIKVEEIANSSKNYKPIRTHLEVRRNVISPLLGNLFYKQFLSRRSLHQKLVLRLNPLLTCILLRSLNRFIR